MSRKRGLFIVFEGIDGAGTTTQVERLGRWLQSMGRSGVVHLCAEPSTGPVGVLLRDALEHRLERELCPETMALLFAADRVDHLCAEIEPALEAGRDVVCDRYVMSSLAYQGGTMGRDDMAWIAEINRAAPPPDLVLMLTVDADTALARRKNRAKAPELYDSHEFQRRVAEAYGRASRYRPADPVVVIDGTASIDAVEAACRAAVHELLVLSPPCSPPARVGP